MENKYLEIVKQYLKQYKIKAVWKFKSAVGRAWYNEKVVHIPEVLDT